MTPRYGRAVRSKPAAAIALGAVVGATCRWGLLQVWPMRGGFPWTVFLINVVGSFVVGVALAEEIDHPTWELWIRDAIGIGFCGGLTTFSTFAVETASFLRDDRLPLALSYVGSSVVLAIVAAIAGAGTRRRVSSLQLPLEGDGPLEAAGPLEADGTAS
jgi:CrcB protein